jgi:DNA-binding transcriptional LysR family regulator
MNFSQIKCFLAASECLNFTKAAERLYLSQPVLSRQIAAMEDELGIELFIREKKTVRLTAAGEVMAEGLRRLAGDYSDLVEKASALHKGFAGTLNIGMIEGQLICAPYSGALASFHDEHPSVRCNLSSHSIGGLVRALQDGSVDIGFCASFNVEGIDDLEYKEVGRAKTFLVIPKRHPLADKEGLTLDDFRNDLFLTLPANESPQISRNGTRSERTLEAPDIGSLALWLEAGYGIFPLNENHSLRNNPNLVFKDIPGLPDSIEVVVWNKNSKNPMIPMFCDQF